MKISNLIAFMLAVCVVVLDMPSAYSQTTDAPEKSAKNSNTQQESETTPQPGDSESDSNPPDDGADAQSDDLDSEMSEDPSSDEELGDSNEENSEPKNSDEDESDGDDSAEDESDDEKSSHNSLFNRSNAADEYSKRSEDFVSIFKPLVASAATSTVKIMSGHRQLALGIVVDADGLILTKASELSGEVTCKLPDGRESPASVYGIHPETDLAMLKIELKNLSPIHWSEEPTPVVGQWLITPNGQKSVLDVGIVGVNTRVIPASSPFIGIGPPRNIGDTVGAKIDSVVAKSPADDADLLVGDTIIKIDDIEIKDWDGLRQTLGQYDANDRITLTILRANKEKKIKLTLAERDKISPLNERSNQQNSMGSKLSRRRKNFPSAFQHDSMLTSTTCGGPVVNLDGQVVGVNIARAGRVSSLALPVDTVLPIVSLLKTGELAPQIVNKQRLAEIDQELSEIKTKLGQLPDKKSALELQYEIEKAKREELEKILKDVQDRLKVIALKSENFGTELDSVKKELKQIEKIRQQLDSDRKQLSTGVR